MIDDKDKVEVLLSIYNEQMTYARHHEILRERSTQIILVVASGLIAVAKITGLDDSKNLIAVALIVIGIFGVLLSKKHYEKHQEHYDQAQALLPHIHSLAKTKAAKMDAKSARDRVRIKFSNSKLIRLNRLWAGINLLICLAGIYILIA